MNMYGHISYIIIHVYEYLCVFMYVYTYLFMHKKFFIGDEIVYYVHHLMQNVKKIRYVIVYFINIGDFSEFD